MASNVKSTRLTASGSIVERRSRLHGLYILAGATAGTVEIRDGGASGTVILTINTPADATVPVYFDIPCGGMLGETNLYATITNAAAVTAFWE